MAAPVAAAAADRGMSTRTLAAGGLASTRRLAATGRSSSQLGGGARRGSRRSASERPPVAVRRAKHRLHWRLGKCQRLQRLLVVLQIL